MFVVSLSLIHYKIFYLKSKHDALPKNLPESLKRMWKMNKKCPILASLLEGGGPRSGGRSPLIASISEGGGTASAVTEGVPL